MKSATSTRQRPANSASGTREPTQRESLAEHRRRQASVAKILDDTFGELAKYDPTLWERRAYLMLVGVVHERLATEQHELPTDELVALAKALAENRRAANRAGEVALTNEDQKGQERDGPLPDNFADIVRRVYGTNFHDPTDA